MKKVLKIVSFLVVCLAFLSFFEMSSSKNISAASYSVSAKYNSSEKSVTVTYSGVSTSSKDWIGIYKSTTKPSEFAVGAALAWVYPKSSQGTVKFTSSNFINSEYSPQKGETLEDGKYKAVILRNNGYEIGATGYFTVGKGEPKYEFDVYSDSHLVASTNETSNVLDAALKDIKNFAPKTKAIISNGDAVDQADWSLYSKLRNIYYNNRVNLPPVYFNLGNHELFDDSHATNYKATSFNVKFKDKFLYFSKDIHYNLTGRTLASDDREKPYYEEVINNNHFIFLASESVAAGDKMDLSKEQLDWLDNKLWHIQNDEADQPVFVFGHGSLLNTVAGSYTSQNWSGVSQDGQLKFILNKYPNVVYITGHSHWNLNANNTVFEGTATYGGGVGATCVNDGGLWHVWCDADREVPGTSQGLHVMVYNDRLIIKGRDYQNKKWIARYVIDLNKHYDSLHKIY